MISLAYRSISKVNVRQSLGGASGNRSWVLSFRPERSDGSRGESDSVEGIIVYVNVSVIKAGREKKKGRDTILSPTMYALLLLLSYR